MSETVEEIQAAISLELDETERFTAEEEKLVPKINQLAEQIGRISLLRGDEETRATVMRELANTLKATKHGRGAPTQIKGKLQECSTVTDSTRLLEELKAILDMAKRAKSHREASIKELKQIHARLEQLLDESTPKT
jgi:hypothetical protein